MNCGAQASLLPGATPPSEQHEAEPRWPVMQAKRDDDLKDSFYLYIMRNSIGAGLRSQYAPNGNMPDRLVELLHELDGMDEHGPKDRAGGQDRKSQPLRKQARQS